jgi:hypothetical protein
MDIEDRLTNDNKTKEQPIQKSPQSDALVQRTVEEQHKFLQERREKVAQAKLGNPDKEPFDIEKFGTMYNLRGIDGKLRVTPELVEGYEADYYLRNPGAKSLQDFAANKSKLDEESGG